MNTNQIIFLVIIILGGILVLASYVLGLRAENGAAALWGGVPENMRTMYTISMLISAVSFFFFFTYVLSGLSDANFGSKQILGQYLFFILFLLILIPSALWLPLVSNMVASPSTALWILIRIVLALVGLASLGVFIALLTIYPKGSGFHYYSALVGIAWFTIHCGILDAILWPYFWNK